MDIMADQGVNQTEELRSISFPEDFRYGATNAVSTCLQIRSNEKVTVITDRKCQVIAASLARELDRLKCEWHGFILEELAQRPVRQMPEVVLFDMGARM